MNILEVKNLTKVFGEFSAVDDVSLSLKEGEILGLLGPNGAGKTTVIQMLLGILSRTSGEIRYFGKELKEHRSEILESVNFSSTYTNFPWNLKVNEVLRFVSFLYKIKDRKKRIEEVIKDFKLGELLSQEVHELSAGQLTRLNLAKAFLNKPKVLLLDEPTASLDPDAADYMRKFLLHEKQSFNVSIIFTSHNMAEVEEVCDRVIFINEGRIVANDTPENLAKTIDVCHISFITKNETALEAVCNKKGISWKKEGRYVRVDVKEELISELLSALALEKVEFSEVSIEKPTLEDFFLAVSRKSSNGKSNKFRT